MGQRYGVVGVDLVVSRFRYRYMTRSKWGLCVDAVAELRELLSCWMDALGSGDLHAVSRAARACTSGLP